MANEKRLIDAYTLAEEIESLQITVAGKPARWNDAKHSVLRIIAEQPDVDAVEVVRCKDCYYFTVHNDVRTGRNLGYGECHKLFGELFRCNDFCSYGERKDNV